MTFEVAWSGGAKLGEGPVWDADEGFLWFVDIKGRRVHRLGPDGAVACWPAPTEIGWVLPAEGGTLLAGLRGSLARFDPDDGSFAAVADVEADDPVNRLNDATVAPDGAVWFGTMDDGETRLSGRYYRWDGQAVNPVALNSAIITNGPAFAPDGLTLYHVDTARGWIMAATIAPGGEVAGVRPFARVDPVDGFPDGVTCDAAGNVWVGLWNGWRARLYAPDGSIVTEVRLPAANITKIALGGPDLRTAYATSASVGLDDEARRAQPDAGGLFSFRVDTPGLRMTRARIR